MRVLLQEQQPPEGSHMLSAKGCKPSEEARGLTQTWHHSRQRKPKPVGPFCSQAVLGRVKAAIVLT